MNTEQPDPSALHIRLEHLLAAVAATIGSQTQRDGDPHSSPPGRWDAVTRLAWEQFNAFDRGAAASLSSASSFSASAAFVDPLPAPWKAVFDLIGASPSGRRGTIGGFRLGDEVALNPQPLPPRYALLLAVAQTTVRRAELMQEFADTASRAGTQQGIIIVGGYVDRFSEDWCATGFKPKWPVPEPHPHWLARELDGVDLIVMATQFEQASKEAFSPELRQHFQTAGRRFASAGVSRIQHTLNHTKFGGTNTASTSGSAASD